MAENRLRRFSDSQKGETTYIGGSIQFSGDFEGDGNIIVSGTVEGNCQLNGTVTITATAKWLGSIRASQMVIAGTVVGDVMSDGQLEIANSARIEGNVSGTTIAVAQGAIIEGSMQVHSGESARAFEEKRND